MHLLYVVFAALLLTSTFTFASDNQSRSFRMGFSTWPYGDTMEAVNDTVDRIKQHGDLIGFHFDGKGIPWPEALAQEPYPIGFESEIARIAEMTDESHKIYLAINPMNSGRSGIASYWGEFERMPLPAPWDTYSFDSPEVIQAYSNLCNDLIGRLSVTYLNIGIEVIPWLYDASPTGWSEYVAFVEQVAQNIKTNHPSVFVGVSTVLNPPGIMASQAAAFEDVYDSVDYLGLSAYPYIWPDGTDPEQYAPNWLSQIDSIANGKPIAICETAFLGEAVDDEKTGVTLAGSAEWQDYYVQSLLEYLHSVNGLFAMWWSVADFDALYDTWADFPEIQGIGISWRDTGLYDGELNPRPALATWDNWLDRSFSQNSGEESCDILPLLDWELAGLTAAIDPTLFSAEIDIDGNQIADSFEIVLLAWALCPANDYPYREQLQQVFDSNVAAAKATWLDYIYIAELFAAYFTISQSAVDLWVSAFNLPGSYSTFKIDGHNVLSAAGDLDDDDVTNREEFYSVKSAGGDRFEFIERAAGLQP